MLLARTQVEEESDIFELLLFLGHGEYSPVEEVPQKFFQTISIEHIAFEDDDEDKPINQEILKHLAQSPNNCIDPEIEEWSWGTAVKIKGTRYAHIRALILFAAQVMPSLDPAGYTPGGDDDYYDYWPSAMDFLREWCLDIDATLPPNDFYKPTLTTTYHAVIWDFLKREKMRYVPFNNPLPWHMMEEVEDRVNELARDLEVARDHIIARVP